MVLEPKVFPKAALIKKKVLTNDLFIIWLKPEIEFPFKPGQYCTIGLKGTERPYSIASAPHEELIELFIELVPDQYRTEKSLTPMLSELKIGETVSIRPKAKGAFVLDEAIQTQVMISTVTGIAPFISQIRHYFAGHYSKTFSKPFYLLQGASYEDEFGYLEEMKEAEKTGKVVYIPTVSRPKEEKNKNWKGQTGRVNLIVEEVLEKFGILAQESVVYLCGNQAMIDDLGNRKPTPEKPLGKLIEKRFRVKEEVYF